jgi:DNA-binding GntR family transcriptional regulator
MAVELDLLTNQLREPYMPMAEAVACEIRASISDGRLKPGTPLRQETLARDFGVSRVPVREALRQLENEGLVEIRPHSGARVAVLDFEECIAIYKIRERLEPLALAESIEHLSEAQLDVVKNLATELEESANREVWIAGDRRFHLASYAGVRTARLLQMIVGFWNTTQHYRRILLSTFTPEEFAIVLSEHRLLVDALVQRDVRFGEEHLRLHLERGRRRLERCRHLFD